MLQLQHSQFSLFFILVYVDIAHTPKHTQQKIITFFVFSLCYEIPFKKGQGSASKQQCRIAVLNELNV